jgi:hypothetical protein
MKGVEGLAVTDAINQRFGECQSGTPKAGDTQKQRNDHPVKRSYCACLFLCLTTTFLLSQSNPVPQVKQTGSFVSQITASQPINGPVAARETVRAQEPAGLGFAPVVTYESGGSQAVSVAVADVNGDGRPDVVVANNCASSGCNNGVVSVLLGNGDGTFQTAVTYGSGGSYAISVSLADVNGDGRPDIVVANTNNCAGCNNGSVSVLLGNGDGTFQTAVTYPARADKIPTQ